MIPQCKGKDLNNVPISRLLLDNWIVMNKYDGNYVQIHKVDEDIKFFTSGNKQFYLHYIAREICRIFAGHDVILEAEYIGSSEGKLGDRRFAAKLTTYRTAFEKGLTPRAVVGKDTFIVFDILKHNNNIQVEFSERIKLLKSFNNYSPYVKLIDFSEPMDLKSAKSLAMLSVKKGYEGCYAKQASHMNVAGTRVNTAIKLKLRPTADLLCISVAAGDGKYAGKIGSLLLKDTLGRTCKVGSGLTDTERGLPKDYFIGKIIEINYEQILDTYIQPTYVCIRADKDQSD